MPSPFPGMNPYLEQESVWHDFQKRLMAAAAAELTRIVRPSFFIQIDEHCFLHEPSALERRSLRQNVIEERVSYSRIQDRDRKDLVTVVELLDICIKSSRVNRDQYMSERDKIVRENVNLLEINLLRGGMPPFKVSQPVHDYYGLVKRANTVLSYDFWPINLRDSLPALPVPLREPQRDAALNLQHVLDTVYDAAGYEDYIYRNHPQPRLSPEDAAWANQFLPRNP
jgi:hypothetical protein